MTRLAGRAFKLTGEHPRRPQPDRFIATRSRSRRRVPLWPQGDARRADGARGILPQRVVDQFRRRCMVAKRARLFPLHAVRPQRRRARRPAISRLASELGTRRTDQPAIVPRSHIDRLAARQLCARKVRSRRIYGGQRSTVAVSADTPRAQAPEVQRRDQRGPRGGAVPFDARAPAAAMPGQFWSVDS